MHFAVAVLLPEGTTAQDAVDRATQMLAPYDENGTWFKDGSRWDWWMVGGRWDGALLGLEWSPREKDCSFCNGTKVSRLAHLLEDGQYEHRYEGDGGTEVLPYGCHVCRGSGKEEAWPTDEHYETLERNFAVDRTQVKMPHAPAAVVDAAGWHEEGRMGWFGSIPDENGNLSKEASEWEAEWARLLEAHAGPVLLVDCHV